MAWTTQDVEAHTPGLSESQKAAWVRVANSHLAHSNEATALTEANTAAKALGDNYVLFEAEMSNNDVRNALEQAIRAALPKGDGDGWVWVEDVYDDSFVYEDNRTDTPGMYRRSYTLDADGSAMIGEPTKVTRQTVYVPVEESSRGLVQRALDMLTGPFRPEHKESSVELLGDLVPLIESSVRGDGTMPIKIIAPGWGNSGYYSAEVLERDGPEVYTRGTHMYLNHPTVTEANERPERDLRDLVGTLASDGQWQENGADGPGIYADAQVIESLQGVLGELAPHIGISHRASGEVSQGEAEGRSGVIVESMVAAQSVDFVTKPAAGGKVLALMESVRNRTRNRKEDNHMDEKELREAQGRAEAAEKELKELKETQAAQTTELARLQEAGVTREAVEVATELLGKVEHLPEITAKRLVESLSKAPPVKDGALDRDAYEKVIEEAAQTEIEYLASLTKSGSITGMGGDGAGTEGDHKTLEESWRHRHPEWSDAQIAVAVNGR